MSTFNSTLRVVTLTLVLLALCGVLFFAPDRTILKHVENLTRSDCLLHRPWLILTFALSDGIITIAYLSMPMTFLRLAFPTASPWENRHTITAYVFGWLALFTLICGINHAFDVVVLRYPWYEYFAYLKVLLALVSTYTALFVMRQAQSAVVIPRGLLQDKIEELRELVRRPAGDIKQYRAILEEGMRLLDSVTDSGRDKR